MSLKMFRVDEKFGIIFYLCQLTGILVSFRFNKWFYFISNNSIKQTIHFFKSDVFSLVVIPIDSVFLISGINNF